MEPGFRVRVRSSHTWAWLSSVRTTLSSPEFRDWPQCPSAKGLPPTPSSEHRSQKQTPLVTKAIGGMGTCGLVHREPDGADSSLSNSSGCWESGLQPGMGLSVLGWGHL